jgi:hypothetical protein
MATMAEYLERPLAERLARLRATPERLRALVDAAPPDVARQRPSPAAWSATEILCHLRDVEELFQLRVHTILADDDPLIVTLGARPEDLAAWGIRDGIAHPLDPARWAEDRQYASADPGAALAAFARRRADLLRVLGGLSPAQWARTGRHSQRGRLSLGDWMASLAGHDDNHLEQLTRALRGEP